MADDLRQRSRASRATVRARPLGKSWRCAAGATDLLALLRRARASATAALTVKRRKSSADVCGRTLHFMAGFGRNRTAAEKRSRYKPAPVTAAPRWRSSGLTSANEPLA